MDEQQIGKRKEKPREVWHFDTFALNEQIGGKHSRSCLQSQMGQESLGIAEGSLCKVPPDTVNH
jgi:hypothetical protein